MSRVNHPGSDPDLLPVAEALPVVKQGTCPAGYRETGGYCAPTSDRAAPAVPKTKTGQCPTNWVQSGVYCVEMRRH